MRFREMTAADIPAVVSLEAACFTVPWSETGIRGELESNPYSHGWLIEDEDGPAAYAFLWETFETGQIARIAVKPQMRRAGLGKKMLAQLEKRAADAGCEFMRLEVRPSNTAALALYEGDGFIRAGITKNYYSDGESAIVMVKPLESEEKICW